MKIEATTRLKITADVKQVKTRLAQLKKQYKAVEEKLKKAGNPRYGDLADKELDLRTEIEDLEEALEASSVHAAAVPTKDKIKLLKEIFKNAELKKLGLKLDATPNDAAIFGTQLTRADKIKIGQALAKLGWDTKARKGVSRADGTWPLIMDTIYPGDLEIKVSDHDTVDKNQRKQDVKDYKSIVGEVADIIGAKTTGLKRNPSKTGAGTEVKNGDKISPQTATKALMKSGYKKPKVVGDYLQFAKDHATVILEYNEDHTKLLYIRCEVL